MKPESNQTKSLWPLIVLTVLTLMLLAQPAPAVNKQWVGDNFLNLYFWTSPNNWSPPGEPGAGDFVSVTQSDTKNRLIWYNTKLNPVLGSLTVNATGSGQITLWQLNNTALSAENERIGSDGTACYVQSGGTNTVDPNDLTLGGDPPGQGDYILKGGLLQVNRDEFIGREGIGNFTQIDGTNSVDDELVLGRFQESKGSYNMFGGNLLVGDEKIGWQGMGAVTQIGGTHMVAGNLTLGRDGQGMGTYELKFGTLEVGKDEFIGLSGTGGVTQTGGQHTIAERLILAGNPGSSGSYHLKFGSLSVGTDEYIGNEAPGVFDQCGGQHTVAGTLTLARVSTSSGIYNLSGGKLSAGTIQINAPAGGGAGGFFNVMNTITTVTGDVINDGTVKTTNAIVTWDGNFTNNGTYISDPSKQTFTGDLEVGADGYLTGASQDLFIIKGDFVNRSENTTDWDTAQATLKFAQDASGDTEHDFYLPGEDNGDSGTNAFVWGTLNILGQTVQLRDGNYDNSTSFGPGAQYVGGLIGAEVNWATKVVNNIFGAYGPVNSYYDPDLLINAYLLGLDYAFAEGSGMLIADATVPTPVPASVLLLGSGLLGLGLLGRQRKRG